MTEWRNADKVFNFKFGVMSFRTQILSLSYHWLLLKLRNFVFKVKNVCSSTQIYPQGQSLCFIFLSTLSMWYGSLLNVRKGEEWNANHSFDKKKGGSRKVIKCESFWGRHFNERQRAQALASSLLTPNPVLFLRGKERKRERGKERKEEKEDWTKCLSNMTIAHW